MRKLERLCLANRDLKSDIVDDVTKPELSTDRMDPRVGSGRGRVGSGRVGSGRVGSGRVGVSTLDILVCLLIISWYLNRYESSNTIRID